MKKIRIQAGRPYTVMVGEGIRTQAGRMIADTLPEAASTVIISDTNVAPLYLEQIKDTIEQAGLSVYSKVIPAGEASKNLSVYSEILSFLAEQKLTRSDVIIALGGGVVGDLAGFAAATFLRGVPYVQIPTSLLAMVDSSVGGKTAVDLPAGKNLAGAFYQPSVVICDPEVLHTLPDSYLRDGCAEVIKYGVLEDEMLFSRLMTEGIRFDRVPVISRCIEIKAHYVAEDEFDQGLRQKLNLGHTFGHAIEASSHFSVTHGQAVAAGMCMIARASCALGFCRKSCVDAIEACVREFGLPDSGDKLAEELLPYVFSDKKRRADSISLIVPRQIGQCDVMAVGADDITSWLKGALKHESND
ncbi:MAG: 3-dehydroquinate synthase [Lachnospiraceae bacterium]|nr:3-dehydroquinate synthase [Lachnospiraceae bacterium]